MLVPVTQSRLLTTIARRTGVPRAVALSVDRARLLAALPETFAIDARAKIDPAAARQAIARLRLADSPVRLAVEEALAPAADVIVEELTQNEVPVPIEVVPVGDLVGSFEELLRSEQGLDLVMGSRETIDRLTQIARDQLFLDGAVTL